MQKILAILNRIDTMTSVLAVAQQIAARCEGSRIVGLYPRLPEDPSFMPTEEVMTSERRRSFNATSGDLADHVRDTFENWRAALGDTGNARWVEVIGDARKSVGAEASRAELIVVGHVLPTDRANIHAAFDAALYDAAAPVVMAPIKTPATVAHRPAIAWENSPAMEKALEAAWPLLRKAEQITVLLAQEGRKHDDPPPPHLEQALDSIGVPWKIDDFDPAGRHIGEALLQHAREVDADLLVMGAYTHSNLIEWVRSGATREMLQQAAIPLLMHH